MASKNAGKYVMSNTNSNVFSFKDSQKLVKTNISENGNEEDFQTDSFFEFYQQQQIQEHQNHQQISENQPEKQETPKKSQKTQKLP